MPKHDYPLHPGQTHAEPLYCTILVPSSAELDKYEKEWVEAERENQSPIIVFNRFPMED